MPWRGSERFFEDFYEASRRSLDLDTECFSVPSGWPSVSETCRPCSSRTLALLFRKRATGCCHVQSRSHLAGVEGSQRSPTPECGTIRESDTDLDRRTGAGDM